MDPKNFEKGLQPKRDLLNNAQNSPFFSKLPFKIRAMIYKKLLKRTCPVEDVRRSLLSPSALRVCRQFYTEAVPILYADNEHKITIKPDRVIHHAAPRLPTQFISTRNISRIQHLKLELQVTQVGPDALSKDDLISVETHLRGIILSLSSSGAVLKSFEIVVLNGFLLFPQAAFQLLGGLKELRMNQNDQVCAFMGIEKCRWYDTQVLVKRIQKEMLEPHSLCRDGNSERTITRMYQDLCDYQNVCIQYIHNWTKSIATRDECVAAIEELKQAFQVDRVSSRGVVFLTFGGKPMEHYYDAIQSIEAIYARIDQQRFGEYHEGATKARKWLYMRKSFREMAPHAVPDVYAWD